MDCLRLGRPPVGAWLGYCNGYGNQFDHRRRGSGVQVYDPAAKQSVWIGLATQMLDQSKNSEKNQKKLDKAMQKLPKDFPPRRK